MKRMIQLGKHIQNAIKQSQPVLALESTIISHGMPYPENLYTATRAEEIVRAQKVVPATIGIINGVLKIGLEKEDLFTLATKPAIKISKRDISYCISNKLNGATTVSATMWAACEANIKVFATGGIGGVHRGDDMDISADLTEFDKSNVAVVSSGVKSILDIPRTLEYLETLGVPVVNISRNKKFPGFFTNDSGSSVEINEPNIYKCAILMKTHFGLNLKGILFSNPIPTADSPNPNDIDEAINKALISASSLGIRGKAITPYLLSKINEITKGKSLESNIALYYNNVKVGAQLAKEYSLLNKNSIYSPSSSKVVILGGINIDVTIRATHHNSSKKSSLPSQISNSIGGVGYNMYKALSTDLDCTLHTFIGNDTFGNVISESTKNGNIKTHRANGNTGVYVVFLSKCNDITDAYSDVSIMEDIPAPKLEELLMQQFDILCCDANLSDTGLTIAFENAKSKKKLTLFEPISKTKCKRGIDAINRNLVDIITPNHHELETLVDELNLETEEMDLLNEEWNKHLPMACALAKKVPLVLAKFGKSGMCLIKRTSQNKKYVKYIQDGVEFHGNGYIGVVLPSLIKTIDSTVTGAGDAAAAALLKNIDNADQMQVLRLCSIAAARVLSK
eukprot:NODE_266_length_12318_cov_0.301498.p1 type:complete len:623 gc:universal NODE_266_length_12318_cov_0.301498:7151-5283(-)